MYVVGAAGRGSGYPSGTQENQGGDPDVERGGGFPGSAGVFGGGGALQVDTHCLG